MPVGATIGAAVIGAGASVYGANKAASAQGKAAKRAAQAFAPYNTVGTGALNTLAQLYGLPTSSGSPGGQPFGPASIDAFRRSPDYKFALDEGDRAIQFSAAAKGGLVSGNTLRALAEYNQGLATQNFGNYSGRLFNLASLGANAAQGQAGAAYQGGAATASGYVGGTNAINSSLGNLANNLLFNNAASAYARPGGAAPPSGPFGQYGSSWQPIIT